MSLPGPVSGGAALGGHDPGDLMPGGQGGGVARSQYPQLVLEYLAEPGSGFGGTAENPGSHCPPVSQGKRRGCPEDNSPDS